MQDIDIVATVLVLAALLGCINALVVRLPAPIGMLLGALGVALLIIGADRALHLHVVGWFRTELDAADLPHVFLDWVLALLLFAGALHVDLDALRRSAWTILALATTSVILSTTLFGLGLWALMDVAGAGIPLAWCVVLGAILAPTDAVVVETLLARARLPGPVRAAIVGESLFNDGAGVVLFLVTLRLAQGESGLFGHGRVALAMIVELLGGAALGCAAGALVAWTVRRLTDEALRLLISLALVVATYRLADALGLSGPVAVVSAGLLLGRAARQDGRDDPARSAVRAFWALLDRLLNLMLFLSIGLQVLGLVITPAELLLALAALPLAVLARLASVVPPLARLRGAFAPTARDAAALTWAGLRGGISIALALTLPPVPFRGQLLVVCYAVVLFSIVVQGLTLPPALRRLYGEEG